MVAERGLLSVALLGILLSCASGKGGMTDGPADAARPGSNGPITDAGAAPDGGVDAPTIWDASPGDAAAHDGPRYAAPSTELADGGPARNATLSGVGVIVPNPHPAAPLIAFLRLELNRAASLEVQVSGGGETWTLQQPRAWQDHELPIVGLKPGTRYDFSVEALSDDGQTLQLPGSTGEALTWSTPDLPSDFPPLEFVGSAPAEMEPGMTLFNVREGDDRFYLVVVDADGFVRWWYQNSQYRILYGHHLTPWGSLMFIHDDDRIVEVGWSGNERESWYAAAHPKAIADPPSGVPVDAVAFHHHLSVTPQGTILTLGVDARSVDAFPTSTTDPLAPSADTLVVGDVITEFTREGHLVTAISLLDVLDRRRVGHDSTARRWDHIYPDANDWSHSNAVVYDSASDAYVVSVRNQDAIIKVDRTSQRMAWILGNHANWAPEFEPFLLTPVGDLEWPFHQHGVELTGKGVGMFDNGTRRAAAFDVDPGPYYSRAVEFAVDELAMTVAQTWSHRPAGDDAGPFFAPIMSDADWQPATGNVLLTAGSLTTDESPRYRFARVLEVTQSGEIAFDLEIIDDPTAEPTDYSTFSADRIADIRQLW